MLNTIMIVDDHPAIREGLVNFLEKNKLSEKVIEAGNIEEAYFIANKIKPELILMDISLNGSSGIELSKKILKENPQILIIILSMYSKTQFIVESLNAGVKGYIIKEAEPEKIIKGIKSVLNGDTYIYSHISRKVINSFFKNNNNSLNIECDAYETLSFREQEILRLIAEGLDIKKIADSLSISVKTANNHRTNIMSKLNCHNSVELVRYALHIGIIDF